MAFKPYDSLWSRLIAATDEPSNDNGCWSWKRQVCRYGYGRFNLYVPGLQKNKSLSAHIVAFVLIETSALTADDLYLAYLEFRCSGLELDHTCENEGCVNIDHLDPVTRLENEQRKHQRRRVPQWQLN